MMRDRFLGCILGLACGDALGATLEFMSAAAIRRQYGQLRDLIGGGWLHLPPGVCTDDTQMMRCLLESIVATGDVQPADVGERFLAWYRSSPPDIGALTRQALAELGNGAPWQEGGRRAWEASSRTAAGNGGVMRCAPIGLFRRRDPVKLMADSRDTCLITHFDPRCRASCVALNAAIARLLHGELPELPELHSLAAGSALLGTLQAALSADLATLARDYTSGYTFNPLATAFWALEHTDSLEGGIIAVANLGGDADTNAAVTGALLGARYGASAIPQRWLAALQDRAELEELATKLYELTVREGDGA